MQSFGAPRVVSLSVESCHVSVRYSPAWSRRPAPASLESAENRRAPLCTQQIATSDSLPSRLLVSRPNQSASLSPNISSQVIVSLFSPSQHVCTLSICLEQYITRCNLGGIPVPLRQHTLAPAHTQANLLYPGSAPSSREPCRQALFQSCCTDRQGLSQRFASLAEHTAPTHRSLIGQEEDHCTK